MKDEQGSVLVEVLVSAILITVAAVGVFNALDASSRSTAQERHRAQAHGLAQADLARMRTMRISDLSNLNQTRVAKVDGMPYTIKSTASFEDESGVGSCGKETTADYIQIRSTVVWPSIGTRAPVVAQSLVAPPNGSVSADSGALVVQIEGSGGKGVVDVGIVGTGPQTFGGSTGPTGCAIFGNLAAGNYTLEISPPPGGELVDSDGNPPKPQPASVVAEGTNTLALQYDVPGRIQISFVTRADGPEAEPVPSSASKVVAFHVNTQIPLPRAFTAPDPFGPEVTITQLFPFSSTYAVYAGSCEANNPTPIEAGGDPPPAVANVLVSAGGTTPVTLELPPLHLTVWDGESAANPGVPVEGASVSVADVSCEGGPEGGEGESPTGGEPVVRTMTTNADGRLDDPGLPFGLHEVCVAAGGVHVRTAAPVSVPADAAAMEEGTELPVYLGGPGAEAGPCP